LGPREKIQSKDWPRLLLCAVFGMVINMLMFFKGLSLSTPINSSVIATITAMFVILLSAVMIRERITAIRTIGILLGFAGALGLIVFSEKTQQNAPNVTLGNILFINNAISYGIYLIIVRPLTTKYHAFTLMKWLFTVGVVVNIPFTITEFTAVKWTSLPWDAMRRMT